MTLERRTAMRRMGDMLPWNQRPVEYRATASVGLRVDAALARALGMSEASAHQVLYGEKGCRVRMIVAIRAFRDCGRNPYEYLAPVLAELGNLTGDVARKIAADARENISTAAVMLNPNDPVLLMQSALDLEREAAEALALAAGRRARAEELRS